MYAHDSLRAWCLHYPFYLVLQYKTINKSWTSFGDGADADADGGGGGGGNCVHFT